MQDTPPPSPNDASFFGRDKIIPAISLLFVSLFLLGWIWPEPWWGTHFLAFLPVELQVGMPLLAGACWWIFSQKKFLEGVKAAKVDRAKWVIILGMVIVAGFCFYQFPMVADYYGDAERFREFLGESTTKYTPVYKGYIFSPNIFHPKNGERTILNGAAVLSLQTGLTNQAVYNHISAISGMLYVLIWGIFLFAYLENNLTRLLAGIAVLTAPLIQNFFGHMEIYAPDMVSFSALLMVMLMYFKTEEKKYLWSTLPLLFICLKFHSASFLFVPAVLLSFIHAYRKRIPDALNLLSWKKVFLFFLVPAAIGGIILYFFVTEDYKDPRFLGKEIMPIDRLFLPIIPPAPPLNRYTMLTPNHFFDYFNVILHSGGAILFVLGAAIGLFRKKINWNDPAILTTGFSLLAFLLFFFTINPLVSLTMDWDLYSIMGPVMMLFTLAILRQLRSEDFPPKILNTTVAISLLWLTPNFINAHTESLSHRIENIGLNMYKGYYNKSMGYVVNGIKMMGENDRQFLARCLKNYDALEPYAIEENDVEFAHLAFQIGKFYTNMEGNPEKGLLYHERAFQYYPAAPENILGMLDANFKLNRFQEAWELSRKLVEKEYPTLDRALFISLHCSLEAGQYEYALDIATTLQKIFPEDELAKEVITRIRKGTNLEELKLLFHQG